MQKLGGIFDPDNLINIDDLTVFLVNNADVKPTFKLSVTKLQLLQETYLPQDSYELLYLFMKFLIVAIVITTGLTNIGFMILLFSNTDKFENLTWDDGTIISTVIAALLGSYSGYAQLNIYAGALIKFVEMIEDGTYAKIAREHTGKFIAATLCALFNLGINFGIGCVGMGIFFASGGWPIIILAALFALANAALVYYTTLDMINKDRSPFDYVKENPYLTTGFAICAIFGLFMTFIPGALSITGHFTTHLGDIAGAALFTVVLLFALATEIIYSAMKSSHLAKTVSSFMEKPHKPDAAAYLGIINAGVNATMGAEGGAETAEYVEMNKTAGKSVGGFFSFGWSATCSAPFPVEKTSVNKKALINNQFKTFIKSNNLNTNPRSPGIFSGLYKLQLS